MYRRLSNVFLIAKLIDKNHIIHNLSAFSKSTKMFPNENQERLVMKPPNILVFNNDELNSNHFEQLCKRLYSCLNSDCYTIYQLTPSQVIKSTPWKENCILLLIYSNSIASEIQKAFTNYYTSGGSILSVCSNFTLPGIVFTKIEKPTDISSIIYENETYHIPSTDFTNFLSITDTKENLHINILGKDLNQNPVIVKLINKHSQVVFSQLDLNHLSEDPDKSINILKSIFEKHFHLKVNSKDFGSEIPKITTVYFTTKSSYGMKKLEDYVTQKERKLSLTHSTLHFQRNRNVSGSFGNSVEYQVEMLHIPEESADSNVLSFDFQKYFSTLKTNHIGNTVMYAEVVNSTMDLIDGFAPDFGLVAIANVQIGGKGRSGNKWLSPDGCAMFSCQLSIPLRSRLGQSISYVQHLATLAIVHSVRKQPGYEDLNVNIKWPNDVYYSNKSKIGGVLVNSILYSDTVICYVGCGINLNNKQPTRCINSIIEESNEGQETNLKTLSNEWFIASVLNSLEKLISDFQLQGPSSCLPLYYRYWIHEGQELKLHDSGKTVIVDGLDEFGYLSVVPKEEGKSGKAISLQPDGNSLDMMKNLIILK